MKYSENEIPLENLCTKQFTWSVACPFLGSLGTGSCRRLEVFNVGWNSLKPEYKSSSSSYVGKLYLSILLNEPRQSHWFCVMFQACLVTIATSTTETYKNDLYMNILWQKGHYQQPIWVHASIYLFYHNCIVYNVQQVFHHQLLFSSDSKFLISPLGRIRIRKITLYKV